MVAQIFLNNNESVTGIFLKNFWDLNKAKIQCCSQCIGSSEVAGRESYSAIFV
jgi:hypothetical protein